MEKFVLIFLLTFSFLANASENHFWPPDLVPHPHPPGEPHIPERPIAETKK